MNVLIFSIIFLQAASGATLERGGGDDRGLVGEIGFIQQGINAILGSTVDQILKAAGGLGGGGVGK